MGHCYESEVWFVPCLVPSPVARNAEMFTSPRLVVQVFFMRSRHVGCHVSSAHH